MERIHPSSYRELEQLVKLHGAERLIEAIREIAKRLDTQPRVHQEGEGGR